MASRSLNKVTLLGNLTRDPELKYTPNGTAVCTIGVATNRSWKTADGQTKEEVQYHRIVAWQKLAELCGKLLKKGSKVYVEGRITYRDYMDKSNQKKYITEIVLDDFILLSSSRSSYSGENGSTADDSGSSEEETPEYNDDDAAESEDVNPDDIPF